MHPLPVLYSSSKGEDRMRGMAGPGTSKLYTEDHVADIRPGVGTDGLAGIGSTPTVPSELDCQRSDKQAGRRT